MPLWLSGSSRCGCSHPCGFEYLRVVVRYADAVGRAPIELSLRMLKPSLLVIDLLPVSVSGVLTFSRLMLFPFPRWSASSRRPLRIVFASLCTLSSKASCSISMCARPSSLPIFGASWSAFWFFLGIRASGSLV